MEANLSEIDLSYNLRMFLFIYSSDILIYKRTLRGLFNCLRFHLLYIINSLLFRQEVTQTLTTPLFFRQGLKSTVLIQTTRQKNTRTKQKTLTASLISLLTSLRNGVTEERFLLSLAYCGKNNIDKPNTK